MKPSVLFFLGIVIVIIVITAAFLLGFRIASESAHKINITPAATPTPTPQTVNRFNQYIPETTIPTPTPDLGPGNWACSPEGLCNSYSEELRQSCPRTFGDHNCLGQCRDPAIRCKF